jgi:hypothetical protein
LRGPEDTSIGAVPLQAAKWSRPGKRDTSRTSPMTAAAMTGPTPNSPVRLVPVAWTAAASFLPGLADLGVDAAQVIKERRGELAARGRHRVRRRDLLQDPGSVGRVDRLADTAGDQVTQHGAQPAHDLGAGPAQIPVALGPDLQHRRVIIEPHFPDTGRAQRGDRDRPGIVGIVLVHIAGGQQPDPRAQLGRHIQHPLTGRQQLLGQQVAQAAAPSTAQVRVGQAPAQASSCSAWAAQARTRSSPSGSSAALIATAVCEALCGSTPIITAAMNCPFLLVPSEDRGGHA